MATFNQNNQTVYGNQNNAETINFGAATDSAMFVNELTKLIARIDQEVKTNNLNTTDAENAKNELQKAVLEAENRNPERKSLTEYLIKAKDFLFSSATLANEVLTAIAAAGALFS